MVIDADADAREVARDRQRHADDAALGRRVGGLADLPVVGGDRRGVDDDAALAAVVGRVLRIAARREADTLNVPMRLTSMILRNSSSGCGPSLPTTRPAVPTPARCTAICTPPHFETAESTAFLAASELVTSVSTKIASPPSSRASASPASLARSRIATFAPRFASVSTVARPSPDAPPAERHLACDVHRVPPVREGADHSAPPDGRSVTRRGPSPSPASGAGQAARISSGNALRERLTRRVKPRR